MVDKGYDQHTCVLVVLSVAGLCVTWPQAPVYEKQMCPLRTPLAQSVRQKSRLDLVVPCFVNQYSRTLMFYCALTLVFS